MVPTDADGLVSDDDTTPVPSEKDGTPDADGIVRRKPGRKPDPPEVKAAKEAERARLREVEKEAARLAREQHRASLKERVDIAKKNGTITDAKVIPIDRAIQVAKTAEAKPRPPPPPELKALVESAVTDSFDVLLSMAYKGATHGAVPAVKPNPEYAKDLGKAWAPIIARYIDADGNFILWFAAIGATGAIAKQVGTDITEARKTIPKKASKADGD
jgi:hypothetical protein